MVVQFLYYIDFPVSSDHIERSDKVEGWLLCTNKINAIEISGVTYPGISLQYALPRPDVALHFKDFPGKHQCGFRIIGGVEAIDLNKEFILEADLALQDGKSKRLKIALDLKPATIQEIEVDDDQIQSETSWKKTEEKFISTLRKHPWITVRMDITNKCNLRCIMCHYSEKEIYSQPAKTVTADELKYYLQDIAPYVKHIMLSCGFEPLMSKHFGDILGMLNENFPHMEIGLCTNGMLLNSAARKAIIEKKVTHVLFSLDGVTKRTVEKIRIGADFGRIVGNIMTLRDLKLKFNKTFPLMYMDFVLMNSNIHEAPAFVEFCKELGIDLIDFRHLVGNIYFNEHDEMLGNNREKFNYYRQLVIDKAKECKIKVRIPEQFITDGKYIPEAMPAVDLSDLSNINPDIKQEEVYDTGDFSDKNGDTDDYPFLSDADCLRPFNEIMIIDQEKILPCPYYNDSMGKLDDNNTLYSMFFNEKFRKVRRKKILSRFDHHCLNCPIKLNLLPTDTAY